MAGDGPHVVRPDDGAEALPVPLDRDGELLVVVAVGEHQLGRRPRRLEVAAGQLEAPVLAPRQVVDDRPEGALDHPAQAGAGRADHHLDLPDGQPGLGHPHTRRERDATTRVVGEQRGLPVDAVPTALGPGGGVTDLPPAQDVGQREPEQEPAAAGARRPVGRDRVVQGRGAVDPREPQLRRRRVERDAAELARELQDVAVDAHVVDVRRHRADLQGELPGFRGGDQPGAVDDVQVRAGGPARCGR